MTVARSSTAIRLSVMMFLQFFIWGAWFVTLKPAFITNGLADIIGGAYGSAPIAAIFAPLFLGLVADRFFPSEKVMGFLCLAGGAIMAYIAILAPQGGQNGALIVKLMIAHMCCFMPTLGLANTITFSHLEQEQFPKVRVWGTIGWIAAGLVIGFAGWSTSLNIFWLATGSCLLLGVYSFTLPNTPAPSKGEKINIRSLFMLDAFKLFRDPAFAVFAICSTLICIPLAYYYGQTADFLTATGFKESTSTMTIGQMSEILFMVLIPYFFRKLGVKMMLLIGMGCWVARYALFAMGAQDQIALMLLAGVALHGICYDFFFVTGFIYTDKKAPKAIRGQAQSLLVFLTQGIGMFVGYAFAFGGGVWPFTSKPLPPLPNTATLGETTYGTPPSPELVQAIVKSTEGVEKGFWQKLTEMFGKGYPDGLDPSLVENNMNQWTNYWYFPMALAGIVFVIFAVAFWDRTRVGDDDAGKIAADVPDQMP